MKKTLILFIVIILVAACVFPAYAENNEPQGYPVSFNVDLMNIKVVPMPYVYSTPATAFYAVSFSWIISDEWVECAFFGVAPKDYYPDYSGPSPAVIFDFQDEDFSYIVLQINVLTGEQTEPRIVTDEDGLIRYGGVTPTSIYLQNPGLLPDASTLAYFNLSEATVNYAQPSVDNVTVSALSQAPYYPGNEYRFQATVTGIGLSDGSNQTSVYWYVHGNTSGDTYIDNDGLLSIAPDETAAQLEIEAISTYDTTKSGSVTISVSYPLLGSMIAPSGTQTFVESSKRHEIQYELILPNGEPFNYTDIEWTIQPSSGASSYFRIDDQGLLVVEPNAPAGASCTVHFAYGFDTDNVSAAGATVKIVSTQEGIYDNLTPTPDQSDKAEEMEDAIGDAADKLENNNSSLGQLTPTRPQINTNLEFDQDQMFAVSPLVTNIWSINGLGRMISIVLVVATVAYIFFGKRDG